MTDEEDLVTRVQEITGGKGVRLVFDPIAGKGLEALAAATGNGIIFEYGALAPEPTPFPLFSVLSKHLTVKGAAARSFPNSIFRSGYRPP